MQKRFVLLVFFFQLISNINLVESKELSHYLGLLDLHPQIQAVQEKQDELLFRAEGAMGLPDPDLFLGIENVPLSDPSFDQYLPSSKIIGFSQNIPNLKSRKAQREVFLSSAQTTRLLSDYIRSQLQASFFTRMADLERLKLQMGYLEKKKKIIAELQEYYEGQIIAGEPLYQKTFVTEIEFAEVEQRLNTLNAEKSTTEADLIQLVGEIPCIDDLHYSQKKWNGNVESLYPVRLASQDIQVEDARVNLADSAYSPDFGLVGTYKIREDGENDSFEGDDWFSIQLRISFPLWASYNQQPKLEAAMSRKRGVQHSFYEVKRKWKMKMTQLVNEREASLLNIDVLRKKNNSFAKKIEAMERTYSAGQSSLEQVLRAELTRLSLLSQIAEEHAKGISITEKLNAHIVDQ